MAPSRPSVAHSSAGINKWLIRGRQQASAQSGRSDERERLAAQLVRARDVAGFRHELTPLGEDLAEPRLRPTACQLGGGTQYIGRCSSIATEPMSARLCQEAADLGFVVARASREFDRNAAALA